MAKKMTEQEQFYSKGYVQGKIDFAKEVIEKISHIEAPVGGDFDKGVDWAVCEVLMLIHKMKGDSDGRE